MKYCLIKPIANKGNEQDLGFRLSNAKQMQQRSMGCSTESIMVPNSDNPDKEYSGQIRHQKLIRNSNWISGDNFQIKFQGLL